MQEAKPTYAELELENQYLKLEITNLKKNSSSNIDLEREVNFHDIFDIDEIQKIQDLFSAATGVASLITYPNGVPITKPSNFCKLCFDLIRKTEKGLKNCYHSDEVIGKQNMNGAIYQPCLSSGLLDGGASISVGGKHIANWLIGQVKNDTINEEKILSYAKEIGADEQEFKKALDEVNVMTTEKFKSIADTLFFFANEISQKAYHNLQLNRLVDELHKKEFQLLKAIEKAEESDRLKTAFLQNMSHEIRTPMNAIVGFADFLNDPDLSNEKRESFTKIIINSTYQLLSIITDILSIAAIETKQEKANIGKVCINSILVELLSIFKSQAFSQNISLYSKQELTDKQSEIYTDKTKITQILTNLITNSLKFTHEGFIEFGYTLKNEFMEFYVKDSGIGIKPEIQDIIFERFRQADSNINKKYGGTGLGLAISKSFTELLGGKIWVESELDSGSKFYFTIPYKTVNNIIIPENKHEDGNNLTILIAEDEEYNFLYLEELLNNKNINLLHAKDGKEAIEYCKKNANIEIVLMDVKMPILDGYSAAKIIKEIRPNLTIIAQSAYVLEHERDQYSGIAFDDYILKPINKELLKQIISKFTKDNINYKNILQNF